MKWLIYFSIFLSCVVVADEHERPLRIAFVGDSITEGQYPRILQKLLGSQVQIKVRAKRGARLNKIHLLLKETMRDPTFSPTHIIVYGGTNDCTGGSPLHKIKKSLNILRNLAETSGDVHIIIPDLFVSTIRCRRLTESGDSPVKTSELRGAQALKIYFHSDEVHLNLKGHEKLAQLIFKQVDWYGVF